MRAREAFATGILSELRSMMVCVLLSLLPVVLLITSSALVSSSGTGSSLSCHPRWFLFGRRCLSFYPVWSSWSDANFLCSQSGGDLVSIHTPEDLQFVAQVAITTTPVWLGGSQEQQNGSWFWTDDTPFRINSWISEPKTAGAAGACMEMTPNDGKLQSAPCDELKFYICSMNARYKKVIKENQDHMDVFKAINIFREHMMAQKAFYKALVCSSEEGKQ
uniref:C-type lectin domain-containing protein n=1 Tax=Oreochromis aureus TaxID=47969 RepID=A0AAZ1XZC0_OREAU